MCESSCRVQHPPVGIKIVDPGVDPGHLVELLRVHQRGRGQDLGGVSQEGGVCVGVATGTGLVQGGEYSGHTLQ